MIDWTDAFDNSSYVPGSDALPGQWAEAAAAFRAEVAAAGRARIDLAYGPGPRNRFDLFHPEGTALGVVVFVHGGYWHRLDKSYFSALARGPLGHGWAVAMPSYTLAPEARIAEITREIGAAVTAAAAEVPGPVRMIGHSAGGHLVARMVCADGPLPKAVTARLAMVVPVSGLHDLRPIRRSDMNEILGLTEAEAAAESPALLQPRTDVRLHLWVGAAERPELLRQTRLLGEAWGAAGADLTETYASGQDHFSVITGLARADSPLTEALMEGAA